MIFFLWFFGLISGICGVIALLLFLWLRKKKGDGYVGAGSLTILFAVIAAITLAVWGILAVIHWVLPHLRWN